MLGLTLQPPDALTLLAAWERGSTQTSARRALTLLDVATPAASPAELEEITVGDRDRYLLTMREVLFGDEVVAVAECPRCGAALELDFSTSELRTPPVTDGPVEVDTGDRKLRVRLPTAGDLAAAADTHDPDDGHALLLERCVLGAEGEPKPDPGALSPAVIDAIDSAIAAADAQPDVDLALSCVDCEESWDAPFDIASFVWTEVDGWAMRALREVHQLAYAYGWSEAEILSLSPSRRRFYLEAIEA